MPDPLVFMYRPTPAAWNQSEVAAYFRDYGTMNTLCGFPPSIEGPEGHGVGCPKCEQIHYKILTVDLSEYGERV